MLTESDYFKIDKRSYVKTVVFHYIKIKIKYFAVLYITLLAYNILLSFSKKQAIYALYIFLAISYSIPIFIIISGIISLINFLNSSKSNFITENKMVRITDDSIFIIFKNGNYNEVFWKEIINIKLNKSYIILFINRFFPLLIPFSSFKPEKIELIKNFLKNQQ